MKARELKNILKDVPDDNPVSFYIIHNFTKDVYLGNPEVICSNGINDEGCVDFGFKFDNNNKEIECQ